MPLNVTAMSLPRAIWPGARTQSHRAASTLAIVPSPSSSLHRLGLKSSLSLSLSSRLTMTLSLFRRCSPNRENGGGWPAAVGSGILSSSDWSSALRQAHRGITIESNETPNPQCMRLFSMEASFLKPEYTVDIPSREHAYKSFLASNIFEAVPDVEGVFIADEYITIRKSVQSHWEKVLPDVSKVISDFVESGEPVLTPEGEALLVGYHDDTAPEEDDDEVVLAVKELLATRIRPMLLADGGNVRYIDMDDGTVFLLLEGACKTCPSSHITLKSGIERMLMHWIPEVVEAQEVSEEVALELIQAKKARREESSK